MEGKGVLIAVVVVAVVAWLLFNKASSTVAGVNKNIKQTYTTGTTINAVATNVAPALGTFLSGLARGSTASSGSSSAGIVSSGVGHSISYGDDNDPTNLGDDVEIAAGDED